MKCLLTHVAFVKVYQFLYQRDGYLQQHSHNMGILHPYPNQQQVHQIVHTRNILHIVAGKKKITITFLHLLI